jgi:hypothetical protein
MRKVDLEVMYKNGAFAIGGEMTPIFGIVVQERIHPDFAGSQIENFPQKLKSFSQILTSPGYCAHISNNKPLCPPLNIRRITQSRCRPTSLAGLHNEEQSNSACKPMA